MGRPGLQLVQRLLREHHYSVSLAWTGNTGAGTAGYTAYSRDHVLQAAGAAPILGSSDPAFRGDPSRWNPEQMLVAALSACHHLWFLHLCAEAGVIVLGYTDAATGTMVEDAEGGRFTEVVLRPAVTLAWEWDSDMAMTLHAAAHGRCFLARSMAFPVRYQASVTVGLALSSVSDVDGPSG